MKIYANVNFFLYIDKLFKSNQFNNKSLESCPPHSILVLALSSLVNYLGCFPYYL